MNSWKRFLQSMKVCVVVIGMIQNKLKISVESLATLDLFDMIRNMSSCSVEKFECLQSYIELITIENVNTNIIPF